MKHSQRRKRDKLIGVYLTKAEYQTVNRAALKHGMTLSDWVRFSLGMERTGAPRPGMGERVQKRSKGYGAEAVDPATVVDPDAWMDAIDPSTIVDPDAWLDEGDPDSIYDVEA